jgi:hypothetical protein
MTKATRVYLMKLSRVMDGTGGEAAGHFQSLCERQYDAMSSCLSFAAPGLCQVVCFRPEAPIWIWTSCRLYAKFRKLEQLWQPFYGVILLLFFEIKGDTQISGRWARKAVPTGPSRCSRHYESETALKGVERRWEALAPVATQRL